MIIDIYQKSLKKPNPVIFFQNEIKRIYVENDPDVMHSVKVDSENKNLDMDFFAFSKKDSQKFSMSEYFAMSGSYQNLCRKVNEFWIDENGVWLSLIEGGANNFVEKIKININKFLETTNQKKVKDGFYDLAERLLEIRNIEICSLNPLDPKSLIESGLIAEEKSLTYILLNTIIEKMEMDKIEIDDEIFTCSVMRDGVIKAHGLMFDRLLGLYGKIGKYKNALIQKLIAERNESAIERVVPRLDSFYVNRYEDFPHKDDLTVLEMAKNYRLSEGLCELIKTSQEKFDLAVGIKVKSGNGIKITTSL